MRIFQGLLFIVFCITRSKNALIVSITEKICPVPKPFKAAISAN